MYSPGFWGLTAWARGTLFLWPQAGHLHAFRALVLHTASQESHRRWTQAVDASSLMARPHPVALSAAGPEPSHVYHVAADEDEHCADPWLIKLEDEAKAYCRNVDAEHDEDITYSQRITP